MGQQVQASTLVRNNGTSFVLFPSLGYSLLSLWALVVSEAQTWAAAAKHTPMLTTSLTLEMGMLEWETTYKPIASLHCLLWSIYFLTAKRLVHSSIAFSNLTNVVLGRGSSSCKLPVPEKFWNPLKTLCNQVSCLFTGWALLFLSHFWHSLFAFGRREKKPKTRRKLLCRDEPPQCNLSMSVKTYPHLLLFGE